MIGGSLGSDDCGGSGTVMKRGDSGGMVWEKRAVVLNARHGAAAGLLVAVVVEMRHDENAV